MFRSLGLAGVLILAPALACPAGDVPKAARWLGPETAIYLEITRPVVLLDKAGDERILALYRAVPGLEANLRGNAQLAQLRQVADLVAGEAETSTAQALRDLTAGGIYLSVEGANRVVMVVVPRDEAALRKLHDTVLRLARKDAAANNRPDPVQARDYRGLTAYSVAPNEAHAIVDGALLVATGPDVLRAAIDRGLDSGRSVADLAPWKARREALAGDALAFAFAHMDRVRELDPAKYANAQPNAGAVFLLGPWEESLRKAPWLAATLAWTDANLAAEITLPPPASGHADALKRFVPPGGSGAAAPLNPPGTIASLTLWRDLASIWEVRGDIFPPEAQQGLSQLDTTAGTFFGGRDFGTGVLGSLGSDWRLVVAQQDFGALDVVPEVKLPAAAVVFKLKPGDEEFATRLQAAFQSLIGLLNLGSAQTKAPPLILGSDTCEGITIATSKYQAPKAGTGPVHQRHNASPSMALVGDRVIVSSTLALAKDLIRALKAPAPADRPETLIVEADGRALAALVDLNRPRLVMQNMLDKGNDKPRAEAEIDVLKQLLVYLGRGRLTATDAAEASTLRLRFDLQKAGD